jgi:hypothetical protein
MSGHTGTLGSNSHRMASRIRSPSQSACCGRGQSETEDGSTNTQTIHALKRCLEKLNIHPGGLLIYSGRRGGEWRARDKRSCRVASRG